MAATLAALTPFQTPVDDAWLQVEKKDGRRSSFTILGVASFANGDLSCASQNVAVIFKVCSASRVNHLPRFFVLFLFFMSFTRLHKHLVLFFYFMFHNFHPQNLFKQAACFQTVKATIGAFFYFLNFLQNKTQLYRHNRSPFLVFLYIYLHLFMFWFFFFFPGRVNGTCPRGAASLVRVFSTLCILTLCWVNVVQPVIFISTVIPCRAQSVNVCVGVSFCNYCHSKPETNMYIMYKW